MNSDNSTQQYHEKERQKIYQASQQRKAKIKQETQLKIGNFRSADDSAEAELKAKTYGLVSLSDFQKLKQQVTHSAKPDAPLIKSKKHAKVQLSFENDDEQEEEESFVKKKKIKKNPDVDTSFLPDKERAQAEEKKREELKKVWLDTQQAIKNKPLTIPYSFFDGSSKRSTLTIPTGSTISQFLEKARLQWHDLRGVSIDNLLFIKEDLIIPHTYSFYDFIINKTRGKSGPLFDFGIVQDVRLRGDASVETRESHAAKVCERNWYDKHKHIFPASRWEVFDPCVDYGKYKVKGDREEI